MNLIDLYKNELLEFGSLERFKDAPKKRSKGGRPFELVLLNEKQKSLLIMFLKNTDKSKKLKANLVRQLK